MMPSKRRLSRQDSNAAITTSTSANTYITSNSANDEVADTSVTFSDIESILQKFSGDGTTNVHNWFAEFERAAITFKWNNIKKFIFCKKLLTNIAKLFIENESRSMTYADLKNDLVQEYGNKECSANIHATMRERKQLPNESMLEYLYIMMGIASRGNIDDGSVIDYVITGVQGAPEHKNMLYGARSIKDFKDKLNEYGKFRETLPKPHSKIEFKKINKKRCYNCGSFEHEFYNCPQKSNGPKCFRCEGFGHKAANCNKNIDTHSTMNVCCKSFENYTDIKLNEVPFKCLIDTGSHHCLLKQHLLNLIYPTNVEYNTRVNVAGLVASTTTKGTCTVKVELANNVVDEVVFHIVDANPAAPDIIIGMELLKEFKLIMDGGKITIEPKAVTNDVNHSTYCSINDQSTCYLSVIDDIFETTGNQHYPDLSHICQKNIVSEINMLISSYSPKTAPRSPVQMKIVPIDDVPIYQRPRRFPPKEQQIIDKQIEIWLQDGIIAPSCSNYASNVVLVKKKDNTHRLCVDFRALNKKILREHFPLPIIDDQVDKLYYADRYSTLDLENAFFHVNIHEDSQKFTSFVTQNGQYQFNKVPFGLSNSPCIFQKYINYIFKELIYRGVLIVYIDDIVIPSRGIIEGVERLKETLQVAADNGLKIKWKKCQLLQTEIEYLGFCIENGRVSPSNTKIKAVLNFPVPTNIKKLQSFIGLANYFRRFIPQFAIKAKPLTDLIKKDSKFILSDNEITAMNILKQDLITKPVLKIFEYGVATELHTDASKEGYGAVLLQKDTRDCALHPVYYYSKKTTNAETKYSSYELEVLAVIQAVKKFRVYLIGQKFRLVTDCKAFECTMRKHDLTTRIARWALLLEEYDYTIEHRAGNKMRHVDALSRNPAFCVVNSNQFILKIREAQKTDERLLAIIEILKERPYKDYVLFNGVLCKHMNNATLMVIPDGMKNTVIRDVHNKGHFHYQKMKEIIEKEFYIDNLQQRVQHLIANCVPCILAEKKRGRQECFLNPIPKGECPLELLHVDHLGPMQATKKGYRYILAFIDGFTKFSWLFPTKTLSADEAIKKFTILTETFGFPERLIADRGAAFTANIFEQFCKENNVKLSHTTVGVPRGNGQVERLHSIVISVLTKLSIDNPEKWYSNVKHVQTLLNATYQRAIKMTPFKLLVGTEMRANLNPELMKILEEETIMNYEESRDLLRKTAKLQIAKLQEENKKTYNAKRKAGQKYAEGDLVAIEKIQFGVAQKIRPKFLGPYRVTKVKEFDRYDVEKVGDTDGPRRTDTSADHMKPWQNNEFDDLNFTDDSDNHSQTDFNIA